MSPKYDFSDARKRTNKKLANEIAALTVMTAEEVDKLLPERVVKLKLERIIKIVNSAKTKNEKLASLRENFEALGGVLLKVLKHVI